MSKHGLEEHLEIVKEAIDLALAEGAGGQALVVAQMILNQRNTKIIADWLEGIDDTLASIDRGPR